jgi:hypothetical protein
MLKTAKKDYNIYTIKPNDTLKQIALAMGISWEEARQFHNIYAKPDDLINMEFPLHLKHLYIPPHISEKKIDNIPMVDFLYDRKLAIQPFKKVLTYEVDQNATINNEITTLLYKITVAYVEKINEYHLFTIDKIWDPEEELPSVFHELIEEMVKAIYPLELIVNDHGNWIGIHNFRAIYPRWQTIREDILEENEGKEIMKRVSFYDALYRDEATLTSLLQKDIFLQTYFNGLYKNHTQVCYFETTCHVAILPNIKNVSYNVLQEVDEYLDQNQQILIQQTGILNDDRSTLDYDHELDDACFKATIPKGNYKANYVLNPKKNTIVQASLHCTIELEEAREINIRIQQVDL